MESLILLHGALGSKDQLAELKGILSTSFNVFTFNFSGHGGRPVEEPFTIDLFARDTLQFISSNQLGRVQVFGYSMGGYVALKLAHDFPGMVNKIMTLGTKFQWDPGSAAKEVKMLNPETIELKIPKFAATLAARHSPEDWKKVMHSTSEMMTGLGNGNAMKANQFNQISSSVLVSVGSEDQMVTREESEITASQMPKGHFKLIDGFKHPIEIVDMEVLAGICVDFLSLN